MKKKTIVLAFAVLLAAGAAACASAEKKDGGFDEWSYACHTVFADEHDGGVTLDGRLDDGIWQDKKYFTNTAAVTDTSNPVRIGATVAMTEKGVYVGAYALDNDVRYLSEHNERNSHFRFYLAAPEVTTYNRSLVRYFRVDLRTLKSANGARFSGAVSYENERLGVELFVSWRQMNVDTSVYETGVPPAVKLYTVYRVSDASSYYDIYSGFGGTNRPTMYPLFEADGYVNADKAGAVLGDAKNGYAKTNGWDTKEADDGRVTVDGDNWQVLYFRDAYASAFVSETFVQFKSDKQAGGTDAPKLGLIATGDAVNFRAFLLDTGRGNLEQNETGYGVKKANVYGLTYYPSATWDMKNLAADATVDMTKYGNRVKLKMVKDGEKLYYFVNDTFVTAESCPYVSGKTFAGFYALDSHAEYTDFRYEDLENDAEALAAELGGAARIAVSAGVGGTLTTDKIAVRSGASVTFAFENWTGYALDAVKVNGTEAAVEASGGSFTLTASSDLIVEAAFAPLKGEQATFALKGKDGAAIGGSLLIEHDTDGLLRWTVGVPSSPDGAAVELPKGAYTATVDSPGYSRLIYPFVVSERDNAFELQLETAMIGNAENEDFSVASSTVGWDYSEEYLGKMRADQNANWEFVYFTEHYSDSVLIRMTIENTTPAGVEREKYPAVLWTAYDGENRVSLGVIGQKIRAFHTTGTWDSSAAGGYFQSDANVLSKSFGNIGARLELMLIRFEGKYYIFERLGARYVKVFETDRLDAVAGRAVYGLTVNADASLACGVTFSDFYIRSGADALAEIESCLAPVDTGIFGDVPVGGVTAVTDTAVFDFASVNDTPSAVVADSGKLTANAYFDAAVSDTAVIRMKIDNLGGADGYPWAGWTIFDGAARVNIGFFGQRVRIYPAGAYTATGHVQTAPVCKGSMVTASASTLDVMLIRYKGNYYVYEKSGGDYLLRHTVAEGTDGFSRPGAAVYGVCMYASRDTQIRFSDFYIKTGEEAAAEIESYLPIEGGVFGTVEADGFTAYTRKTDYDFSLAGEGTVAATLDSNNKRAYFAGVYDQSVVVKMTVTNRAPAGYDRYAAIGFTLFDGTNRADIMTLNGKVRVFPSGTASAHTTTPSVVMSNVGTKDLAVEIMYVRDGDRHYLFEKKDGAYGLVWMSSATNGISVTGKAAYGVRFNSGSTTAERVELTGLYVRAGAAAADEIAGYLAPYTAGPFGAVSVNDALLSADRAAFDLSTAADGYITAAPPAELGSGAAYFRDAVSDTAVIKATVRNMWTSGDKYTQAGFMVNDGTNKFAVLLIAKKCRVYPEGVYTSAYIQTPGDVLTGSMLGSAATDLEMTFIRYRGAYYLFENANGVQSLVWSMAADDSVTHVSGPAAYGVCKQGTGSAVRFSDCSALTGAAAEQEAQKYITE